MHMLIHPTHAINRLRVVTRLARRAVGAGLSASDLDDPNVRQALVRLAFLGENKRFDAETWTWVQVMVKELTA